MLISRIVPQITKNMAKRNYYSFANGNIIASPPTKNVSFADRVGCGLMMLASIIVIPAYIIAHMEEYKAM